MSSGVPLSLILAELNRLAPLTLAESWDNVGLLIGDTSQVCRSGLTCLTLTPDVAQEAITCGVDIVITHHPVLFRPVQRLTTETAAGAMLLQLIRANIAVYSPHTAYDSAETGVNQQLANAFGLQGISPLRIKPDGTGAGRWGQLPTALSLSDLNQQCKTVLHQTHLQFTGDLSTRITTLGIACGSAAEFLPDAAAAGCQALLTGEARFHDALRARELGIALILAGHYATERFAQEVLAQRLQSLFAGTRWSASQTERDPVCWG